jgi:1-acyl-sn-glycerol-3-phosphate acyltransferase
MPVLWIYSLTRLVTMALLRLYFRIEYRGVENIPTAGPFLLTPNHVSYADPLWVSAPVRRPMRYMTWDIMTKKPRNWPAHEGVWSLSGQP